MKVLKIVTFLLVVLALPISAQAKLFLADANDTLEVVTVSAVSTINVQASWADITTTTLTPGVTNTLITTGAITTVVASPGASTQRQIKGLTIYNSHASSSNGISVQHYDGTNRAVMLKYTLLAGETIQWNEDVGFNVIDASGNVKGVVVADTEMPAASGAPSAGAAPTAPAVWAYISCQDFGASTYSPCQASPNIAHDAAAAAAAPLLMGGYASAAAPSDVSADNDAVRAWHLRNGATVVQPSYAGILGATGNGVAGTGTPRITISSDNTAFPVNAQPLAATSGGTTPCYIPSAASTNATNCKASAGQLYGFDLVNTTATIYYLRLYNLASAPTCSSATGFVRTIPIPASTTGGGISRDIALGEVYGTGLGFCLTGGGSSTDNTNAATGVYVTLNFK